VFVGIRKRQNHMNVGMKRDTLEIVSAESLEYELDGACASGWFTPRDVWPLIAYLAGQPGGRIFLRTGCEPAAARRRSGKLYYGRQGAGRRRGHRYFCELHAS
jgi:hypothetical protein